MVNAVIIYLERRHQGSWSVVWYHGQTWVLAGCRQDNPSIPSLPTSVLAARWQPYIFLGALETGKAIPDAAAQY